MALLLWPNTGLSGANTGRGRRGGVALPNTTCKCEHSIIFTMNPPPPFVLGCKSCYTLGHYITSMLGEGTITSILGEGTITSILGEGTTTSMLEDLCIPRQYKYYVFTPENLDGVSPGIWK